MGKQKVKHCGKAGRSSRHVIGLLVNLIVMMCLLYLRIPVVDEADKLRCDNPAPTAGDDDDDDEVDDEEDEALSKPSLPSSLYS